MTRFHDKTVLITGGARGLGKLIAGRCLEERAGCIVLWDIDAARLDASAAELRQAGGRIETAIVDVSSREDIERAAEATLRSHGPVDILFNNAGVVVGRRFAAHSGDDIERTMRINAVGPMHVARVFLPGMLERGAGHVVNIASAAGLVPNPNLSVYSASKWAVLGWSESLRLELEQSHPGVHVTTVCPSYADTGMFAGARAPRLTSMLEPEVLVDRIVRAVKTDKILLRAPRIINLLPFLRGAMPARAFDVLVGRTLRIYSSMDQFTGHAERR